MGSIGFWLALISQFEYSIRILAAAAAAAGVATCADAYAGALQSFLLEWRGLEEACSKLKLHKRGSHTCMERNVHPQGNVQNTTSKSSRAHACNMIGGVTWRMHHWIIGLHWLRLFRFHTLGRLGWVSFQVLERGSQA
eukprot:8485-Pelagomonas_calceolata.AAC.2